jgi:hypothetical protein
MRTRHFGTRTSRMRCTGVKLTCYLNTECDRGRATIIHLPEECDTIGEVLQKIQARMNLDARMLYAAELFLPNGDMVRTYKQLIDAAEMDTAIIVGCGEPFDNSTVPYDILEFHLHGGGRAAARMVKYELAEKRRRDARERADSVRASGHGVAPNSAAVVTARSQTLETNREQAAHMRHEYMEQLMFRASQQKDLVDRVQENSAMHKMEQQQSRLRRQELARDRLERLAEERSEAKRVIAEKREASKDRVRLMHTKLRREYELSAAVKKHRQLAQISGAVRI